MTITAAQFRTNFPPFSDTTNYPEPVVGFYLALAYLLLPPQRWVTVLDYGVQLFVAHNLVLEFMAQTAASKGQPPGLASGPVSSKSAGPVSIAWDTGSAAELNAGHWNNTIYGQQFIRLARLIGAGGMQLGVGWGGFAVGATAAWTGPPPWPGWFSS